MAKNAAIVVLYNENYDESIAYQTLNNLGIDVFLFDNSTNKVNVSYNKKNIYMSGDNIGLSKAYNLIIKEIKDSYNFIIISDSDTCYDSNYLEALKKLNKNTNIALPYIKDNKTGKLLWPQKHSNKMLTLLRRYKTTQKKGYFHSINSGVIYNTKVFNNVMFNEDLWIDCVDFSMFDVLKEKNIEQEVLNETVIQDFSTHDEDAWVTGRVKYTYRDLIKYYGKKWYFIVFIKYLMLAVEYKDLKYLKAYYKIYFKKEK